MCCAQSFNWSHWTPQVVENSLHIAPGTASIQAIDSKRMHLTRWWFQWPWRCASTVPSALTNALCSALQFKPLDAAIVQLLSPYCPGDRQGPIQTSKKHNKNKCTSLAGHFDVQGDAPVQYRGNQLMRRAQHFNWSHWTPQSVKYSLHIAPVTARVPFKHTKEHNQTTKQRRWRCKTEEDKGWHTVPVCRAQALTQALVQLWTLRKRFHCYGWQLESVWCLFILCSLK